MWRKTSRLLKLPRFGKSCRPVWLWWAAAASLSLCQVFAFASGQASMVNLLALPVVGLWMGCCCAGGVICCCEKFFPQLDAPATLTLTIQSSSCSELNGETATLDKVSAGECPGYDGVLNLNCGGGNFSVNVQLRCVDPSTTCEAMQLTLTPSALPGPCTANTNSPILADPGCSCDPVDLTFCGFTLKDSGIAPGTCDCCSGTNTFCVNIVE